MWSSGFERGPCRRTSRRKPQTRGALQFLAPNEGPFCALCRLDGNFELIFGQFIMVWYQSLLSEIHFTLIKAICCTFELAVTYIIHCWWCTRINIAPMNAWLSKCVRNVCAETHTLPVWVERSFSSNGESGGTTSPRCCQSGWRCHSVVIVRAEEPHHLGVTSLGGETIQLWRSGRRNHITSALPVWVGRPFSCDGQSGGTTSPGCCQAGFRHHSAVTVRVEEPHHLGVTSLGGETIHLWWSERRNHITWVLPVWEERPFRCDGQSRGTTSPGRYQSRWGDHSAVMVRAEEPHHPGAARLGLDTIQLWRSGRRNHITWALPV